MFDLKPIIATVLLALPSAVFADGLLALNGASVRSGPGNEIEVFTRAGFHGADYFCAAGDFARRKMGASATDRVAITRAPGGSPTDANLRSMSFELIPAGASYENKRSFFLSPKKIGLSRTVAHSVFLCRESRGTRIGD